MAFLNNILLLGLPAILLPVIIHLLNRLRYRSVNWAAVMFLVKATRSSTRHARLRQYLILLFRTLIVLFLIVALARPIMGGWIGMRLAGAPDTVIILLDRSASMETVDPRLQTSKREQALEVFSQAHKTTAQSSRLVLIENVFITPAEVANAGSLKDLASTAATDTMADIPAMLRAAVDYMIENQTGRTELWLASDFQENNWRPDSAEWQSLVGQIASLPQPVSVRILNLQTENTRNRTVSLADAFRSLDIKSHQVDITIDIEQSDNSDKKFPLLITMDGARSQVMITMPGQTMRYHRISEASRENSSGGWGKVELPADDNITDNCAYFVYGGSDQISAAVVSRGHGCATVLSAAAAPAPALMNRSCEIIDPNQVNRPLLNDLSMLIWQDQPPAGEQADLIKEFARDGGTVIFFPPATKAGAASSADSLSQTGLVTWAETEQSEMRTPFRVISWDEYEGPLAKTYDGNNLPVASLEIKMRRCPTLSPRAEKTWTPAALYADGKPFLLRQNVGRGQMYICTSLPDQNWSDLAQGMVLVPMLQRIFSIGGSRRLNAESALCGEWEPRQNSEVWICADSEDGKDYQTRAGVYNCGNRRTALNRPPAENSPVIIDSNRAQELFGEVRTQVNEKISGTRKDQLQSEIWHILICLAILCMIAESALLLQEKTGALDKSHKLD